jgi:prepilin-type N-terminal cleavage/methylation domain-containing protein
MRAVHRGFSLVELLIVVAIILIIAAIAIPNFMRSRIAANQASAIESLRVIGTAEVTYGVTYGHGFSASLSALGPPATGAPTSSAAAGLIDEALASGAKSGYSFIYSPALLNPATGGYDGYSLLANPSAPGQSGTTYYYTDATHVIRGNALGTASSTDSAVAN